MSQHYNYRDSSSFSKFDVKSELLSYDDVGGGGVNQVEMKFVEENIEVKHESEGNEHDIVKEEIFPDLIDPNNDPLSTMSSVESCNSDNFPEQAFDFYDESEYQDEEEINDNYDDDSNDPVDTLVDLDTYHKQAVPPVVPPKPSNDKVAYLCTLCKDVFQLPNQLQSHMTAVHFNEMPFRCADCDLRFKTRNILNKHIKLCHSSNQASSSYSSISSGTKKKTGWICEFCFQKFKIRKLLLDHQSKIHSICSIITSNYKCDRSDRQFRKCAAYQNHKRNAHGRNLRKKTIRKIKSEYLKRRATEKMSKEETIKVELIKKKHAKKN